MKVRESVCEPVCDQAAKNTRRLLNKCTFSLLTLSGCTVNIDCDVGTCQVDMCKDTKVLYASKTQLGSLVQAGMKDLTVKFLDGSAGDFVTGLDQLRAQHPDVNINDEVRDPPVPWGPLLLHSSQTRWEAHHSVFSHPFHPDGAV